MLKDDVITQIAGFIRHVRRDEALAIDADTRIDTLGIDSLDFVELLFMIEEKFDIDIGFNANADGSFPFETVGSAADAVCQLVGSKTVPA
ncbi:acyl carrier protein [Sandaracinobacteroides saxicola]|uniref:Acyl carrier protein n=1 Tax=Sandaracinobacteroides saxicola TaxID=2759707 RepID=A0A7G5IFH2_9SPHN|nr:acyl carrier protein [Sandaracinobacteroides saxicola]QMW22114.1 acyl carrier protein [Sandaracinobacteroides saxicola]